MTSKEALKQYREIYIDKNYNGDIAPSQEWFLDIIEKDLEVLKEYKSIEEENGIDLIALFKALKDGFYIKYNDKIVHIFPDKHITINFWYKTINVFIPPKFFIDCKKGTDYLSETIDEEYWFKDYGETWALTREELEDDK